MRDRDIDDILKQLADAKQDVDPALVDRISNSIGSNLQPSGTLAASWILLSGLVLICALVAIAGAMLLGPHGIQKMTGIEIGLIFPFLGLFILLAATLCVTEAIPGSRRLMSPLCLGVSGCIALIAVFGLLFHDYRTEGFVSQGVKCLAAGLACAVPVYLATWMLLKRGFCVNSSAAGLARGTLAGLAGVTMLELHCPNFEAPHLMVWHVAVVLVSAAVGMIAGTTIRSPR